MKYIATLAIIILCAAQSWAACSGSSPDWTAASPSASDVNDCIIASSAGDTINVPSGNANWGAGAVTIPANKPLQLIGAGMLNTIITLTGGSAGNATVKIDEYRGKMFSGIHDGARVTGFTFQNTGTNAYQAMTVKGQGWRVDHNRFINPLIEDCGAHCMYYAVFTIQSADTSGSTMPVYGVIDNNIFYHAKLNFGQGSTSTQADAWSDPLDLGGPTAIYIEDNKFLNHAVDGTDDNINKSLAVDTDTAAKIVVRYNYLYNFELLIHPWQSNLDRGPRKAEVYHNTFHRSQYMTSPSFSYFALLSGTGVVFNNNLTGAPGSGDNSYFFEATYRRANQHHNGSTVCGICDGTASQYWDGNEPGQSGHLCRDQIGAGRDLVPWSGNCSDGGSSYYTQELIPAYGWNNPGAQKGRYDVRNTSPNHVIANRDYYYEVPGYNGTSGVGCGTLANRPATCAAGVGYWIPNTIDDPSATSCSNLAGFTGEEATYKSRGKLYVCGTGNQWTEYYTPYTYPHPLRGDGGEDPPDPDPPDPEPTGLILPWVITGG